ncbi:MAG: hypothetical protein EA339_12525 [Rhodobacteraceae bacterium]|nr:MAG: hypothetical protein EA339_12525 [Paracoccaceae bacterium]
MQGTGLDDTGSAATSEADKPLESGDAALPESYTTSDPSVPEDNSTFADASPKPLSSETDDASAVAAMEAAPATEDTSDTATGAASTTDRTSDVLEGGAPREAGLTAAAAPAASLAAPGPIPVTPPQTPAGKPGATPGARGGVFPLVLGGLLAGGIGYGAHFLLAGSDGAESVTAQDIALLQDEVQSLRSALTERAAQEDVAALRSDLSGLRETLDAQSATTGAIDDTVSALGADIAELRTTISELPASASDIGAVTRGDVTAFADSVAELEAQFAALQSDMSALRGDMEDLRDLSERRVVEAEAQVDDALARSGLEIMTAALAAGRSYADALGLFREAGVTVPDALAAPAATGVPTLEALQERFPPAARAALRAEYAQAPADSAYDRVANFLRAQAGVRSTAPKEGDDTDAILSRAGAAVEDGAFAAALGELDSLTEPALGAMQPWMTDLRTRLDAEAALAEFTTSLSNE